MSNYHVKNISENGRNATVVFHIPMPDENNSVPVSLRLALSEYVKPRNDDGTYGTFQSQLQGITAGELTQLQNGDLYERQETVKFLAADTDGQKQTKIDDRYRTLTITALDSIRTQLKFWGKDRDVP